MERWFRRTISAFPFEVAMNLSNTEPQDDNNNGCCAPDHRKWDEAFHFKLSLPRRQLDAPCVSTPTPRTPVSQFGRLTPVSMGKGHGHRTL